MPATPSSPVLRALVSGTATAAYYAAPDVITSRTARAWSKAGLMAVVLATSAPDARIALDEVRRNRRDSGVATPVTDPVSTRAKAAAIGAGIAAAAGAAGLLVVIERWIFRRGQGRAAAGVRWPHTRPALFYGAIAAGLALVPMPTEPDSPDVHQ